MNFSIKIFLQPDGIQCKYTGRRYLTINVTGDTLEKAKENVTQMLQVLLIDGVKIGFCDDEN